MENPMILTLEQLKQTEWFKERPEVIQKTICKFMPTNLYKFIETDEDCRIIGYTEYEGELEEDVTFIIETRSGAVYKKVCRHKIIKLE